ncbi:S-layer homology domain-containing protein [Cohnella phaseoli]|uniref:S-layer family protein n=1 Tax=Cohnella phaseoli TaxID=456490 RepID=A0A3D9IUR6_9BACL|nr:S-layer homology domain-containing protein [Cohnella phaseoli]RED65481.1 S-layer family protein [Cohnella phaseoli]
MKRKLLIVPLVTSMLLNLWTNTPVASASEVVSKSQMNQQYPATDLVPGTLYNNKNPYNSWSYQFVGKDSFSPGQYTNMDSFYYDDYDNNWTYSHQITPAGGGSQQGPNWTYGRISNVKISPSDDYDAVYSYAVSETGVYSLGSDDKLFLRAAVDGYVNVAVYQNDQRIWPAYSKWKRVEVTASSNEAIPMPEITTAAKAGDQFYFRVNAGDNPSNDNLEWRPYVSLMSETYTVEADLSEQAKQLPHTSVSQDAMISLASNDAELSKGWMYESYSYGAKSFTKLDQVDGQWLYTGQSLWGSSNGAINSANMAVHPGENGAAVYAYTMPRNGTVSIATKNDAITVESGANVALFKGNVKIWPTGEGWHSVDNNDTSIAFDNLTVSGFVGDQIRFVVAKSDTQPIQPVWIDPMIDYIDFNYVASLDLERNIPSTNLVYNFKAQYLNTNNPSGQWEYMYVPFGSERAVRMPHNDGENWRMNGSYSAGLIRQNGMLAGAENDTLIAFKAPYTGTIQIALENGTVSLADSNGNADAGDGVKFGIFLSSTGSLIENLYPGHTEDINVMQDIANGETKSIAPISVNVRKNEYIWFRLNLGGTQNWHDSVALNPIITYNNFDPSDPGVTDEPLIPTVVGSTLQEGEYPLAARDYGDTPAIEESSSAIASRLKNGLADEGAIYRSSDNDSLGFYGNGSESLLVNGNNAKIETSTIGDVVVEPWNDRRFSVFIQGYKEVVLEDLTIHVRGGAPEAVINTWNVEKLTLKNVEIHVDAGAGRNGGAMPIVRVDNGEAITDLVLDKVRIVMDGQESTGVDTFQTVNATVMNSYIQGGKHAVNDNSLNGAYIGNNVFVDQDNTAINVNTSYTSIQNNSINGKSGIRVQPGRQNVLIGLNKIVADGSAITVNGARNVVSVRNEAQGDIEYQNGSGNASIIENQLDIGLIKLNDTAYALVNGNEGAVSVDAGTATNAYGNNILDYSVRAASGANLDLLPKIDKELFVGMPRRETFNWKGRQVTLKKALSDSVGTQQTVLIPPGAYATNEIAFDQLSGTSIYAYGALAEFERYTVPGITMNNSSHITIKGLVMDSQNNANAQGTIVAVNGKAITVIADPGFLPDFTDPAYYPESAGLTLLKPDANGNFATPFADGGLGNRTYDPNTRLNTFTVSGAASDHLEVGNKIVMRGITANVNKLMYSSDIRYEDVSVLNGSGFGFSEYGGDKATTLWRVAATPAAAPLLTEGTADFFKNYNHSTPTINAIVQGLVESDAMGRDRGSKPLISTADATHSTNKREGMRVYHSLFENMTDDATNVNGEFGKVVSVTGNTVVYTKGDNFYTGLNAPFRVGDHVLVFTRQGKLLADTLATSATRSLGNDQYEFTIEGTFALEAGTLVENESANGGGFVFDNNYIDNNRSRGLLVKAFDGKIAHNTLKNNGMSAILVKSEIEDGWSESGPVWNLLIENNLIENSGFYTGSVLHSPINISGDGQMTSDPQYLLHKHITIRNNVIRNRNTMYAINVNGAQDVTIEGNVFEPRKGYTDSNDDAPAIYLNGVNGVVVSDNNYPSAVTQKLEATVISKNITGTDVNGVLSDYLEANISPVFVDDQWKMKLVLVNTSADPVSARILIESATANFIDGSLIYEAKFIPAGQTVSFYYDILTLPSDMIPAQSSGNVNLVIQIEDTDVSGKLSGKAFFNTTPKAAPTLGAADSVWQLADKLVRTSNEPDNLSMTVQTLWDENYFYLLADVIDDVHLQEMQTGEMWMQDSVQFAIDPGRDAGYGAAGKIEFTFALTNNGTAPKAYIHSNTIVGTPLLLQEIAAEEIGLRIVRNDETKHTVYFAALPWTIIGANGVAPLANANVGINVAANDSDDIGRSFIELYGGIVSTKSAEAMGATKLLGESVSIYPIEVESSPGGRSSAHTSRAATGELVLLHAKADPGYVFKGWQLVAGEAVLKSADNPSTSFVMPAGNVAVRAKFLPIGSGGSGGAATNLPGSDIDEGAPEVVIRNGIAHIKITVKQIEQLIARSAPNDREVVIRPRITEAADATEVVFPGEAVDQLVNNAVSRLLIDLPQGTVILTAGNLKELAAMKSELTVSIGIQPVGRYSFKIKSGDKVLNHLGSDIKIAVDAKEALSAESVPVLADGHIVSKSAVIGKQWIMALKGSSDFQLMEKRHGFQDVVNRWSMESIGFAAARGLFTGTSGNTFSPTAPVTRGMLVTILHRLDGEPVPAGKPQFGDVADGKWYSQAVAWAAENRLVTGTSDATFNPEGMATREQFCVILYNYLHNRIGEQAAANTIGEFADHGDISTWAVPAVTWATSNGLLSGTSGKLLEPKEWITREQAATIMERLVKLILS